MNHHFRYVLPCFPFAFIWIGQAVRCLDGESLFHRRDAGATVRGSLGSWGLRVVFAVALLESLGSSLWVYPHSGSYFNLAVGGPMHGPQYLLSSNIDWGQDLLNLKRWLDAHPEAAPLHLAYKGYVDPQTAGIEPQEVPRGIFPGEHAVGPRAQELGPQPGWFAVSVSKLYERDSPYAYLRRFEPVATAGYSIYIYHITPEEAERVRREMGLPTLEQIGLNWE
jgi:hypothetical protein